MRILFAHSRAALLRHFEPVLRGRARRGHEIHAHSRATAGATRHGALRGR